MMSASTHDFTHTTVIGARYLPGFQTDLTSWTLIVNDTSHLSQILDVVESTPKKTRRAVLQLDEALVMKWIMQLDELDFAKLEMLEQSMLVDDASTYTLLCRFASVDKSITLRTLDWFVMQGQQEMVAFRAIWDAIHAVAPFLHTRRPWTVSR